jgi:hypothetical protein
MDGFMPQPVAIRECKLLMHEQLHHRPCSLERTTCPPFQDRRLHMTRARTSLHSTTAISRSTSRSGGQGWFQGGGSRAA